MKQIDNDKFIIQTADRFGTPLYIYDRSVIEDNLRELTKAIYPGASLYYAMKANPLLGICEIFRDEGIGVEVASAGELATALKAGFAPDKIIFTSPGKTEDEIRYAIDNDIKVINAESFDEAVIIDRIAKECGKVADIGIRINPAVCYSNAKIKMSGVPSQFGIEEEDADVTFFDRIRDLKGINTIGIQIYMGTQMLNAQDILKNTEYAITLGLRLSEEFGFELKYLNCGGGFGVKYFKNETALDRTELADGMRELGKRFEDRLGGTEVIFESGRHLMATAGVMVTKVLYDKESKGQRFLVCDGGSNIHSSAAFLGRFVRNNFPFRAIGKKDVLDEQTEQTEATICGPLCTALDVIGQKVMVDKDISVGDLIVIEQSGAYGYTYSPVEFLSHETPAEVLIDVDECRILRQRGIAGDHLRGQESIRV